MNLSDGDMNFEPKMKKEICVYTLYLLIIYIYTIYMYRQIFQTYLKNCIVKGSDSGGLESSIISGDGENESLGSFIFRSTHDFRKLCVI